MTTQQKAEQAHQREPLSYRISALIWKMCVLSPIAIWLGIALGLIPF